MAPRIAAGPLWEFSSGSGADPPDDDAGVWRAGPNVKGPSTDVGDHFGWDVALSGDGPVLAVAARYEDGCGTDPADDSVGDSGAVFLY
jgi:hypothetical protein